MAAFPNRQISRLNAFWIFGLLILQNTVKATLECNPSANDKKADPENTSSYLYCNLEGIYVKRDCPNGREFNPTTNECEPKAGDVAFDDPFLYPQFQAPDDICGYGGLPLTRLSAPVICNPAANSCPENYECTLYIHTGTHYCCQNPTEDTQSAALAVTCSSNQVTFYEPITAEPRSCVLSPSSSDSTCPVGFGCNLVGGTLTRCCGRDFGCPYNSAGFVNPHTGGHVPCTIGDDASCPEGFTCSPSSMFNGGICCSDTSSAVNDACLGDTPLTTPNPCSASTPCPSGYNCQNGRCCPARGMCPVGLPLGGVTSCSALNPCPNNYQCVTSNGQQYCCPAPEHVCQQPMDHGNACATTQQSVVRYYFDESTGSCRAFRFSQCGGNANNFDTLEQCEGFCLSSQCPQGRPYRAGASNAACSPVSDTTSTCPNGFSCMQPLFGLSHVCCSSEELACRDPVSAGSACFGDTLTIQRFHFNLDTGRCESFQFYGCHGSSNNFFTRQECESTCVLNLKGVCNGAVPLMDPSNMPQRCSPTISCPVGNTCSPTGFCCPQAEYACSAPRSVGNMCSIRRPETYWFYDSMAMECVPFTYNGCGGTANRFISQSACEQMCRTQRAGACPQGMSIAEAYPGGGVQSCDLSSPRPCIAPGASCVLGTNNAPICCRSLARCPLGRQPYIIPGSDSTAACSPEADTCPNGYQCMQSGTVTNFYMCCSSNDNSVYPRTAAAASYSHRRAPKKSTVTRKSTRSKTYHSASAKCPTGLSSNNQRCVINAVDTCPRGYVCLGPGPHGVCCRAAPKCALPRYKPYYFSDRQVIICGEDQIMCPDKTACVESTIDGVDICCQQSKYSFLSSATSDIARCRDNQLPFFELGSRDPKSCDETSTDDQCPNDYECSRASDDQYYCCPSWEKCPRGSTPFLVEGTRKPLGCNILANNCPKGYTCEGPKDRSVCCKGRATSASCPAGRKPFLYAGRPLVCPPGTQKCPAGHVCVPSTVGNFHICCSIDNKPKTVNGVVQDCPNGAAYGNPLTHKTHICDPEAEKPCPSTFMCIPSQATGDYVCCSDGPMSSDPGDDNKFEEYCPPNQIPHILAGENEPSICHMALKPCPTHAPYQCIYSAEKQNSYCCAPIGTKTNNMAAPFHSRASPTTYEANIPRTYIAKSIQLLSSATLPPALPGAPISGCPPQSQPLFNGETRMPHECSIQSRCPESFTCYSNYPDGRNAHCCTTTLAADPSALNMSANLEPAHVARDPVKVCPAGFIKIGNACKRMFFVGQPGCSTNEQCSALTNSTYCEKGYCRCPDKKLIHQSECVDSCPDGYVHIAGRCHDLTTIVFMDSVEDRANGTIGGFCMETVIADEQCLTPNAYCNERSITCHCKPGYELKMNFEDKNDGGSCIAVEDSKYESFLEPAADDYAPPDEIPLDTLPDYFVVNPALDAIQINITITDNIDDIFSTELPIEATEQVVTESPASSASPTLADDPFAAMQTDAV